MATNPDTADSPSRAEHPNLAAGERPQMLIPQTALRILCQKTGGTISRSTFYRWVGDGRIASIRLGTRIFIPRSAIDQLVQKCFAVD